MLIIRNMAIAVFFIWILVDSAVIFRYKTGEAENRDRASLKVVTMGNLVAWTCSIYFSFISTGAMQLILLQIAGLTLLAAGIALRFVAVAQLGRFHTPNVAILADHQLMDSGLYRHVRHPSYLGALIAFLGFGLALGNWFSVVVILLIIPYIYIYRIDEEEQALATGLGDPYIEYCKRTKRLIPGVY